MQNLEKLGQRKMNKGILFINEGKRILPAFKKVQAPIPGRVPLEKLSVSKSVNRQSGF